MQLVMCWTCAPTFIALRLFLGSVSSLKWHVCLHQGRLASNYMRGTPPGIVRCSPSVIVLVARWRIRRHRDLVIQPAGKTFSPPQMSAGQEAAQFSEAGKQGNFKEQRGTNWWMTGRWSVTFDFCPLNDTAFMIPDKGKKICSSLLLTDSYPLLTFWQISYVGRRTNRRSRLQ